MAYKTLCWKCKNCCSVNDCEFVYKIDKYYRNTSNIIDENGNVKLIRDLTKYYIPGTKTDTQGNILYCPKFEEDGLNHKNKNYYIQKQTKKNGSVYFYYRDKKTRKHIKLKDIGGCENDLSKC